MSPKACADPTDRAAYCPKLERFFHETRDSAVYYSSAKGNQAWRSPTDGSVFISTLCDVIEKYGKTEEFDTIVCKVNKRMTKKEPIKTNVQQPMTGVTKPMKVILAPSYEHCLTKKIRFYPMQKVQEKLYERGINKKLKELEFANDMLEKEVFKLKSEKEILDDQLEEMRSGSSGSYVADSASVGSQDSPIKKTIGKMDFRINMRDFDKKTVQKKI